MDIKIAQKIIDSDSHSEISEVLDEIEAKIKLLVTINPEDFSKDDALNIYQIENIMNSFVEYKDDNGSCLMESFSSKAKKEREQRYKRIENLHGRIEDIAKNLAVYDLEESLSNYEENENSFNNGDPEVHVLKHKEIIRRAEKVIEYEAILASNIIQDASIAISKSRVKLEELVPKGKATIGKPKPAK